MFPRLFSLAGLTIHTYGVLLAAGFLVGLSLAARFAAQERIHKDRIWDLGLIILLSALVGAKLLLFASEFDYYREHPGEIFSLSTLQFGGVYYGGLLLALLAAWIYLRKYDLPGWQVSDLMVPGLALGHAIGRLGCFSAGCCWGKPAELPWAVTFTNPYAHENVGVPLNVPLHPTQLYEAAAELLIFAALLWMRPRKKFQGQLVLSYIVLYGLARFSIEFFRDDPRGFFFDDRLSTSQLISLLVVPAALAVAWHRYKTMGESE